MYPTSVQAELSLQVASGGILNVIVPFDTLFQVWVESIPVIFVGCGAGVGADDLADKIVADIFPKLGGIGFVDLKKDGALDTDAFVVFGGGQDRLIAESLLVFDIEAVAV